VQLLELSYLITPQVAPPPYQIPPFAIVAVACEAVGMLEGIAGSLCYAEHGGGAAGGAARWPCWMEFQACSRGR
jgi:hypothetical protein